MPHYCFFIDNKDKEIVKLIESNQRCMIGIWNFHSGKKIDNILFGDFSGIFLLNNNHVFLGYEDGFIKIKKIKNGINIQSKKVHKDKVLTIKYIYHPKYGECIISQSLSEIKLWIIK